MLAALGAERCFDVLCDGAVAAPALGAPRDAIELTRGQAEGLAELADRATRTKRRGRSDERGTVVPVDLRDSGDQRGADVAGEVDVDVGQARDVFVQEAADRQVVLDRVDMRQTGQVADDR